MSLLVFNIINNHLLIRSFSTPSGLHVFILSNRGTHPRLLRFNHNVAQQIK